MSSRETFHSKVDWWIAAVLMAIPIGTAAAGAQALADGQGTAGTVLFAILGLFAILFVFLLWPVEYRVTDAHLVIRSGVVRHHIPLTEISEVRPSRNPLSAPALSLDRLMLDTGQWGAGMALISPERRDAFLDLLAERAGLTREGDVLRRGARPVP